MRNITAISFLFVLLTIACTDSPHQTLTQMESKNEPKEDKTKVIDSIPAKPVFSNDYIMGKFNPEVDERFSEIPTDYASRTGMYMRTEALDAFKRMADSAQLSGINLKVISATRNFHRQKQIWESKWTGARKVGGKDLSKTIESEKDRALKILEFSSMPGTSRHHWGTDIDINSLENKYFEKGKGEKEYEWLVKRAKEFGFCQTYTAFGEDRPHGYHEEKWHWSYAPLAKFITAAARSQIKNDTISGFLGAKSAIEIDVVNKFILGINPHCNH